MKDKEKKKLIVKKTATTENKKNDLIARPFVFNYSFVTHSF